MTEIKARYKVKLKISEHTHQCHYFRWIGYAYPDILAFAIPNGGSRDARTGAMLKKEGVVPGIPDIMIASANGSYHGLFIEMKTESGMMSESQLKIKEKLESDGYKVEVCRGWDAARQITESYLNKIN